MSCVRAESKGDTGKLLRWKADRTIDISGVAQRWLGQLEAYLAFKGFANDAEDAAQVALMETIWKGEDVKPRATLAAYLHGTARYCAADLRAKRPRKVLSFERAMVDGGDSRAPSPLEPRSMAEGPATRFLRGARASVVRDALLSLPKKERRAIWLVKGLGHKSHEAAARMRESAGTVRWLVSQAAERLRPRLEQLRDA